MTVQATKQAILAGIEAAEGSGPMSQRVALKLAAAAIKASLNSRLWTDGNHPSSRLVFNDEKLAAAALGALEHLRHGTVSDATLRGWVEGLVADDRALAEIAIADATAAGDNAKKLLGAARDVAGGDSADDHGNAVAAIAHYADAWDDVSNVSHTYFLRHGSGDYRHCGRRHR
ncbi:MAG: hypothetical protein ACRDLK_00220 [Gaiellaceae bacterium]